MYSISFFVNIKAGNVVNKNGLAIIECRKKGLR